MDTGDIFRIKTSSKGNSLSEIINNISTDYPDLQKHLLNANGKVPSFINIIVDDDIMNLQQEQTD